MFEKQFSSLGFSSHTIKPNPIFLNTFMVGFHLLNQVVLKFMLLHCALELAH